MAVHTLDELKSMSVAELKAIAKDLEVKNYSKMVKQALIDAILQASSEPVESEGDSVPGDTVPGNAVPGTLVDGANDPNLVKLTTLDVDALSFVEQDVLLYGYTFEYDNKSFDIFVNNIFSVHNTACLFRFFLSRCESAMIVYFYNPNTLLPMKSSIHLIQKINENTYEENISINIPSRQAFKTVDTDRKLTHLHHKYNTFVIDNTGRITTKSNVFCGDPFMSNYVYYNFEYTHICNPIASIPDVTDVRLFANKAFTELGVVFKHKQVPYWKTLKRAEGQKSLFANDIFSFDTISQSFELLKA